MRIAIKTISRLLFSLCFVSSGAIAEGFENIDLKSTKVAGNVYMLEGVNGFAGGNIGVSAGKDGILIVDDQFKPMSEKIRKALSEINNGDLKFVLNTHWHGDHTQGNQVFGKEATIVSHTNVRKRLSTDQKNDFGMTPAGPPEAWPVITFDDSLSIHFNSEEVRVFHLPNGHTDGDGVVLFTKSNVAHLGDLFFAGRFPFIDLNTGGNAVQFEKNIAQLLKTLPKDAKLIPGHGPLTDMAGLKKYHEMLVETIGIVRSKASTGKSLEEIKKEGLPTKWSSWGTGFIKPEKWIEIIFKSL